MSDITKTVINAFYNQKTGLTRNIARLKEKNPGLFGIPNATIRKILDQNIEIYNKNNSVIHKKENIKYRSQYVGQLLQADLMFVKSPRNTNQHILIKDEDNEDNQYVLMIVDTYSRYIWAYPLKTKASKEVTRLITDTINFIREFFYEGYSGLQFTVYTDGGLEFSTRELEKLKNVRHKIALQHAAMAESAIYRLRTKIKYLDGGNKKKIDNETFLDLIRNLNLDSGADDVFEKRKDVEDPKIITPTEQSVFNQGDFVRIKKRKFLFEKKSGLSTFSEQVFVIADVIYYPYDGVFGYKILTLDGELYSRKTWLAMDLNAVPITFMKSFESTKQKFTKEDMKQFYLKH